MLAIFINTTMATNWVIIQPNWLSIICIHIGVQVYSNGYAVYLQLVLNINPFSWQGMTELPDYNKITFPEMPPIPLEKIVPDASPVVCFDGSGQYA